MPAAWRVAASRTLGFSLASTNSDDFATVLDALLAVMAFGVGDQPVIFLLSVAAVWPLLLNTAAGVAGVDAGMLLLAKSLCANRFEMVVQVILPSILSHLVTGLRLAVGIAWIVLVPAEMLGVRAGLGYYILDAVYSATIPPQTPLRRSWQRSGPAFQ
jgi:ABC-type nitrate/sulfonate/bicarbonate transport system permease component